MSWHRFASIGEGRDFCAYYVAIGDPYCGKPERYRIHHKPSTTASAPNPTVPPHQFERGGAGQPADACGAAFVRAQGRCWAPVDDPIHVRRTP